MSIQRLCCTATFTSMVASRGYMATQRFSTSTSGQKPSLGVAEDMPLHMYEMSNEAIITMAFKGDQSAVQERLTRIIMATDSISWDEADNIVQEMAKVNDQYLSLATLPYKVFIALATTAGIGSFPFVFHLGVADWFNKHYVTTDVPEPEDLETMLEVGSWTWNWMEPIMGQLSFFLLCLQFARAQMQNIGKAPFTRWVVNKRAMRLCAKYPKYNAEAVIAFARGNSTGLSRTAIDRTSLQ
mmetsp:Transcript_78098/g.137838  ORF Transcript_78098/g.137838 Transcript_78098/m.137838 type:complete len:241 (-) Transcript_78098:145-867(-)